jgi:hypothetical protein
MEQSVTGNIDALLPSAKDQMGKIALAEAEEAEKQARAHADADAEKKALVDHLSKPSGISDEEAIRRGMKIIERAVKNRLTEVEIFRFPQPAVHGQGTRDQSAGAGLGKHSNGPPQGNLSFVGEVSSSARL